MGTPKSAADPPGTIAPRDFSILITDTQDRLPAHRLQESCDDAKCDDLCYQRGGFIGGVCGDNGKCDCTAPSAATDVHTQAGTEINSIKVMRDCECPAINSC